MVCDGLPQDSADVEPARTASRSDGGEEAPATGDVTRILSQIEHGDGHASEQLLPLVYEELRKLAAAKMAEENPGQTLQATALVHEAYIRLVDTKKVQHWNSRGHFFGAAAEAMRRILVEAARHKMRPDMAGNIVASPWRMCIRSPRCRLTNFSTLMRLSTAWKPATRSRLGWSSSAVSPASPCSKLQKRSACRCETPSATGLMPEHGFTGNFTQAMAGTLNEKITNNSQILRRAPDVLVALSIKSANRSEPDA